MPSETPTTPSAKDEDRAARLDAKQGLPVRKSRGRPSRLNTGTDARSAQAGVQYLNGQRWLFGKGSGACLALFNAVCAFDFDLVKGGEQGSAELFLPDGNPNWDHPSVMQELTTYQVSGIVSIEAQPVKRLLPVSTAFKGAERLCQCLKTERERSILFQYQKVGGSFGYYSVQHKPLHAPWIEMYDQIIWPSLEEVEAAIPVITWEDAVANWPKFAILAEGDK